MISANITIISNLHCMSKYKKHIKIKSDTSYELPPLKGFLTRLNLWWSPMNIIQYLLLHNFCYLNILRTTSFYLQSKYLRHILAVRIPINTLGLKRELKNTDNFIFCTIFYLRYHFFLAWVIINNRCFLLNFAFFYR